jgi:PmbA protein
VLPNVTVHDDPHVPYSPFSSLFDVEGCPTKKVTILRDGVLEHPLFTSSLLKEFEDAHPEFVGRFDLTGHAESSDSTAPTNTYIEIKGNAALSIEELLGKYPHIAYINSLTGMSLDPLTGQFALDAEGVKIYENGEVRYSTSLTLRGNFFEALRADGNWCGPKERYYYTWAPSLLTRGLDCVPKEMASHE